MQKPQLNNAHPIIGIVVISLIILQPVLGVVHHNYFKRTSKRTFWATVHVWLGRALILLGIINGGLGLQLSDNTTAGEIAYGVIAGVVFLIYIAVIVVMGRKKNSNGFATGFGRRNRGGEKNLSTDGSPSPLGSRDEINGNGITHRTVVTA